MRENKKLKSIWGYRNDSPFNKEPYIDIKGNDITMVGVPHDILALPDNDKPTIMKPGKNYKFPNSKLVREIPLYQKGGEIDSSQVKQFNKEKLKAVQLDLQSKGLYKGKIDGVYGKQTEDAIRKYNYRTVLKSSIKVPAIKDEDYRWDNPGYTGPEKEILGATPEKAPQYNTLLNKALLKLTPQSVIDKLSDYGGENTNQKEQLLQSAEQGQSILDELVASINKRDLKGNMSPEEQEIRNRLYRTIFPAGYDIPKAIANYEKNEQRDLFDKDNIGLEQLWAKYVGSNLYKGNSDFVQSEYKPSVSKENAEYLDSPVLNKELSKRINRYILGKNVPKIYQGGHDIFATVGNVKLGKGKDKKGEYISYYDVFDINPLGDKVEINKYFNPSEIYGRIYKEDLQKQYKGNDFDKRWDKTKFNKEGMAQTYSIEDEDFQQGGNFGLAGENTMLMSPFISLKPFINKYKLKYGGVIDYMSNLPEEQQYLFAEEFDGFDKDTQDEIADYLNGGYYQMGGSIPVQPSVNQGYPQLDINNIEEGVFYVPDDREDMLETLRRKGYAYNKL